VARDVLYGLHAHPVSPVTTNEYTLFAHASVAVGLMLTMPMNVETADWPPAGTLTFNDRVRSSVGAEKIPSSSTEGRSR
jgi:hypothetical protein